MLLVVDLPELIYGSLRIVDLRFGNVCGGACRYIIVAEHLIFAVPEDVVAVCRGVDLVNKVAGFGGDLQRVAHRLGLLCRRCDRCVEVSYDLRILRNIRLLDKARECRNKYRRENSYDSYHDNKLYDRKALPVFIHYI